MLVERRHRTQFSVPIGAGPATIFMPTHAAPYRIPPPGSRPIPRTTTIRVRGHPYRLCPNNPGVGGTYKICITATVGPYPLRWNWKASQVRKSGLPTSKIQLPGRDWLSADIASTAVDSSDRRGEARVTAPPSGSGGIEVNERNKRPNLLPAVAESANPRSPGLACPLKSSSA